MTFRQTMIWAPAIALMIVGRGSAAHAGPLSNDSAAAAVPDGVVFVEAESFTDVGDWVVEQQCTFQMGSPFLLAHGLGVPVADAKTAVAVPRPGAYRELRRLLGNVILTQADIQKENKFSDGCIRTNWLIDLHDPTGPQTKAFPGEEFRSRVHGGGGGVGLVPYRCLYSRNVPNLLMAGRDISVTHVALGPNAGPGNDGPDGRRGRTSGLSLQNVRVLAARRVRQAPRRVQGPFNPSAGVGWRPEPMRNMAPCGSFRTASSCQDRLRYPDFREFPVAPNPAWRSQAWCRRA